MSSLLYIARRGERWQSTESQGRETTRIPYLFTPKARRLRNAFAADSVCFLFYFKFFIKFVSSPPSAFSDP